MKLFSWQKGRQGTGYEVLTLINSKRFNFDLHLLRYKPGTYIPYHTDPSKKGYEHHRLNIVVKKARIGGQFLYTGAISNSRFNKFRPDVLSHGVNMVVEGTRYVLSIGWLKRID